MDFAVPSDHKVNMKEDKKKDKYMDLAREQKHIRNMKVMVIGALEKISKGLEDLEIREQAETTQNTTLSRSAWILRRVLETWGDLLSLKLQWQSIS